MRRYAAFALTAALILGTAVQGRAAGIDTMMPKGPGYSVENGSGGTASVPAEDAAQIARDEAEGVIRREAHSADKVTLSFIGDLGFGEGYTIMNYYHSTGDRLEQCILPDVLARMDAADIMMVNNEYTYSNRGKPLSGKTYTFRTKPETAVDLLKMSADIVSVANNHIYDYGETALIDTLDTLDQYGIPYVGAGRNLDEAKKIVYFRVNGIKIAYVSATQVERSYVFTKEATADSAGVLRTYDPSKFLEVIREADANSDFVVVYVHWGTEGTNQFEADQQSLGHQYIDAGADLVMGDHPHRLQGIEYYKGVPILYSLGNFWFNSSTLDTGIAEVDITKDGIAEFRFVPCLQKGCRTSLVTDAGEKQRVLQFMQRISVGVAIDENGVVRPAQ